MSSHWISDELRAATEERAGWRCEYCFIPEATVMWPHEPDHIIATQHRGTTEMSNLALACFHCNRLKGPNLASVDPQTGQIALLFNPRLQVWSDHFRLEGSRIVPLTVVGRATAELLHFNAPDRLLVRQTLQEGGRW